MIREYENKDLEELLEAWYSASKVAHPFLSEEFLELDVFKDNTIGRNFYKKYGFIEEYEYLHKETGFMQLRLKLTY